MTDIARLQIRIDSLEAKVAEGRLDGLRRTGGRAEKATDGVTAAFKRFAGPVAIAAAAVGSFTKLVSVGREFDVLNAQLITATGSAENAAIAFEAIQDFASQTPYDLAQVTDGFNKLVNLGLTPSEAALTSYGNTASAMGRDLNQLIEAVADAATGEFERLKEFGIKAKSQGDQVSFTFRGVTTTIGKNAEEIEQYLIALGQNEFAGAMQQRVMTLDGALSNLGDSWDKLFLTVNELGVGGVIEDTVRLATDALEDLTAAIASGQLSAYLGAITEQFQFFSESVVGNFDYITKTWFDSQDSLTAASDETVQFIIDAFKFIPTNIKAIVQAMAVEFGYFVDRGQQLGSEFVDAVTVELDKLVAQSAAYGKEIYSHLSLFADDFNLTAELAKIEKEAAAETKKNNEVATAALEATQQARRDSLQIIFDEREAELKSFRDRAKASDELRKKYDAEVEARRNSEKDRLGQFKIEAPETATKDVDAVADKAAAKQKEQQQKAFDSLKESLRTEEEVIQDSYDRRLAIILQNTEEGSEQQARLKQRLDEEFATQAIGVLAAPDTYQEQLDTLNEFYEARRELILNNTQITEEQRTELETELTNQRNERLANLEQKRLGVILGSSSELFGELGGLAKQFAGEQSVAYKTLFAASKAFAIAESIVAIQQGIANAVKLGFPANIPAIAAVVAQSAGILSTIQGTNYSGGYDAGGTIPGGKFGIVGEYGPEIVQGPASVTGRRETADSLVQAGRDNAAPQMQNNIRIVNNVDPEVFEDFLGSEKGEQVIMNIIRNNPETVQAVGGA